MSCHGCAEKFGFLKKEHGCPKCGFAYCKKCLRFQITDPSTKKELMVCVQCQQRDASRKEPMVVMNALQRLESLDDPAKPPITVYRQPTRNVRLQELRRGLSVEDQHILERLESLKKDDLIVSKKTSPQTIEEEIAERLAKLKGEEFRPAAQYVRNIKPKPQTEDEILDKFSAEVEIDTKYEAGVVRDIEERLARLRGEPSNQAASGSSRPSAQTTEDHEDLSEEDQINLIMQRLRDELALENKLGENNDMDIDHSDQEHIENKEHGVAHAEISDDEDLDPDELCGICSEKRATLQCQECDGDIFCKLCFGELHRDLGEIHQASAFKKS